MFMKNLIKTSIKEDKVIRVFSYSTFTRRFSVTARRLVLGRLGTSPFQEAALLCGDKLINELQLWRHRQYN